MKKERFTKKDVEEALLVMVAKGYLKVVKMPNGEVG
jgi:hypothetical protein